MTWSSGRTSRSWTRSTLPPTWHRRVGNTRTRVPCAVCPRHMADSLHDCVPEQQATAKPGPKHSPNTAPAGSPARAAELPGLPGGCHSPGCGRSPSMWPCAPPHDTSAAACRAPTLSTPRGAACAACSVAPQDTVLARRLAITRADPVRKADIHAAVRSTLGRVRRRGCHVAWLSCGVAVMWRGVASAACKPVRAGPVWPHGAGSTAQQQGPLQPPRGVANSAFTCLMLLGS
jgi:hypothetical protein